MLLVILFWVRFLSTYTLTIWLIYCKGSSDTENSEKGEIVRIGGNRLFVQDRFLFWL